MSDVNLIIQGKSYPIACDAGQEMRVRALGRYLDEQVGEIARTGAATEESHLWALTGLILVDRIDELQTALNDVPATPPQLDIPQTVSAPEDETEILAAIEQLASRIDSVAERLLKV